MGRSRFKPRDLEEGERPSLPASLIRGWVLRFAIGRSSRGQLSSGQRGAPRSYFGQLPLAPIFERAVSSGFRDPVPARGLDVVAGAKGALRREAGGVDAEEALVVRVLGDDGLRIDARERGEDRARIAEAPAPHQGFPLEPSQQVMVWPQAPALRDEFRRITARRQLEVDELDMTEAIIAVARTSRARQR